MKFTDKKDPVDKEGSFFVKHIDKHKLIATNRQEGQVPFLKIDYEYSSEEPHQGSCGILQTLK